MCVKDPESKDKHKVEDSKLGEEPAENGEEPAENGEESAGSEDEPEGESGENEESSEIEDPQQILRAECLPHCQNFTDEYERCNERVRSKTETTEVCFQELIDLVGCVEHCVTPQLFQRLV